MPRYSPQKVCSMAKERCLKKTFQDSLEDIKERMKEKRNRKLAKVATGSKVLSTKAKIITNCQQTATMKSFEANNKALALALEAEKFKTRQAQDLVVHLKSEHQRLMFEIFLLKRKLSVPQASSQADDKLASLKGIIAKVTQNLLETANLLGPAHALCSSNHESTGTASAMDERGSAPSGTSSSLVQTQKPATTDARKNIDSMLESSSVPERRKAKEVALEKCDNGPAVKRLSRGRKSSLNRRISDNENSDTEAAEDTSYLKNVSLRRRPSSLNICIEECSVETSALDCMRELDKPENISPVKDCLEKSADGIIVDVCPFQSPSNDEIIPFTKVSAISSSTPDLKPKQVSKAKNESRPGREKVRKSKADKVCSSQLKKPWEKPRARSKSRERGASKSVVSKDKLNSSLNSGDAYDFFCEESIHVTPFRQNKQSNNPKENDDPKEGDISSSSIEDLDDSLYLPFKQKSKGRDAQQTRAALPLRPRSKRSKSQQQHLVKLENSASDQPKQGESEAPPQRISLSDVTNFSLCSGSKDTKKHSFPFASDCERKRSETSLRKRRCTVTVNYAEPSLHKKLRRGDPFTDTEFLSSPIFKGPEQGGRKSLHRKSLARYNEAFVGCGR